MKERSQGDRRGADCAGTTRRQYDRWAAVYDRLWRGYVRATTDALVRHARLRPGEAVLNVGCGTGAFEEHVLADAPDQPMTGVDLSEKMLAAARAKTQAASHARFVQADARDLPFASDAFDVVVSASVLHYLADPVQALSEMRRVARPGGRVVLLDWCRNFRAMRWMDALLRRVDPAHERAYSLGELEALLQEAGLSPGWRGYFHHGWWWSLMCVEARPGYSPEPDDG